MTITTAYAILYTTVGDERSNHIYCTLSTEYCYFWQPAHVGRQATAEKVAVDVKKRRREIIQTRSLVGEGAIKKNEPTCYIIGMLNIISQATNSQKRKELELISVINKGG